MVNFIYDVEVPEMHTNGTVFYGNKTSNYRSFTDNEIVLFNTWDSHITYEAIKNIRINEIPNNSHFELIDDFYKQEDFPFTELPYPFNGVTIAIENKEIWVCYSAYVEFDKWKNKWDLNFYFKQIIKYISDHPVKEIEAADCDKEILIGFKIMNYEMNALISDVVQSSIETLKQVIEKIDHKLSGLLGYLEVLEIWEANKENSNEEFWHTLFLRFPWIISQVFSLPVILFQNKAYLGGKSLDNSQGNIVDLIYRNSLSSNLALVELKTPKTPLVGTKYRNTYTISKEVIGAVNQLLKYKDSIHRNWFSLANTSPKMKDVFGLKCLLITGDIDYLNDEQQATIELFRNELRSVEIITYSELFTKIKQLLNLIKEIEIVN